MHVSAVSHVDIHHVRVTICHIHVSAESHHDIHHVRVTISDIHGVLDVVIVGAKVTAPLCSFADLEFSSS